MTRVWLVLPCLLLAGCGGGAAQTGGAKEPAGAKPMHYDEDAGGKKGEGALEPIDVRAGKAQASFDEANNAFTAAGSDCAQLCKALGSMTRATERLCELSKESGDDKKCTDATSRLETARAKVKSTCGGCE